MTVYFATRNGDPSRAIKIGHSSDVQKRMANLECSLPEGISVLATCLGGEEVEAYLHELLADHRIKGEWYRPHEDVMRWVDQARHAGRLFLPLPVDKSERRPDRPIPAPTGAALQLRAIADTFQMTRPEAAAFMLERLTEASHRGPRIDTWTSARDRAAKSAGISSSMARRIWQRNKDMRDVSGEALHSLMLAYEAMCERSGRRHGHAPRLTRPVQIVEN